MTVAECCSLTAHQVESPQAKGRHIITTRCKTCGAGLKVTVDAVPVLSGEFVSSVVRVEKLLPKP